MSFAESFLEYPDLFPARRAGERWGDETLVLRLAGGLYRFDGLSSGAEQLLHERYGAVSEDAGGRSGDTSEGADVETVVLQASPSDFIPIDLAGKEYTLDLDYGADAIRVAAPGWVALLELGAPIRGALFLPAPESRELVGIFENYLRIAMAYRLLATGGALFHSAGVVAGGAAHLFLGRSGAGKSTLSGLSQAEGRLVLSDELNAVTFGEEGGVRVSKLPFAGDFGDLAHGYGDYPLAALYRLEKGPSTSLHPLSKLAAAVSLASSAPFVNADPHREEALLAVVARLVAVAPLRTLSFPREGPVWPLLDAELSRCAPPRPS